MDRDEARREVLVSPRRAFIPMPDTRVIERPGWMQLITPSMRAGGLNEVSWSRLSEADADAVVEATLAEYRALGIRFRWMVGPDAGPDDLGRRLEARGLRRAEGAGVVHPTDLPPDAPAAVTVQRVDETTVDDFTRVMADGWGVPREAVDPYHRRVLADPGRRQRLYLARIGDRAIGAAACFVFPRSAYLMGGVVHPDVRGRGAYRALVAARMTDARRDGLPLVTCQATGDSSLPILERLGFTTVGRLSIFSPAR